MAVNLFKFADIPVDDGLDLSNGRRRRSLGSGLLLLLTWGRQGGLLPPGNIRTILLAKVLEGYRTKKYEI